MIGHIAACEDVVAIDAGPGRCYARKRPLWPSMLQHIPHQREDHECTSADVGYLALGEGHRFLALHAFGSCAVRLVCSMSVIGVVGDGGSTC